MSRFTLISAASLAALALAACGDNPNNDLAANDTTVTAPETPTDPAAAPTTADADASIREAQDFVNAAGQASLAEIRTSEMALQKSKNADVKAFAQKMIDDHKAAGEKLKAAASAAALAAPPETLDDFHMRRINDLVETDGDEDFDADYMSLQVDAHNDAIKLFEDYSKDSATISQIKMFADESLPTLNAHKADAEKIRETVKKAGEAKNPS
jgi:putative membrane protein